MSLLHFILNISEMDHKSSSLGLFPRLNQYEVIINKNVLITEPDIRALKYFNIMLIMLIFKYF